MSYFKTSVKDIISKKQLPPDGQAMLRMFRAIGYTVEEALSDLIDNCIDAKSTEALIEIGKNENGIQYIRVIDNGHGISPSELEEAMGLGYKSRKGTDSLGLFGLGMKTAAFAIAGSLTVVSKTKKTKPVGALWNEKNILDKKSDWSLAYLEETHCQKWFSENGEKINIEKSGTIVQIEDILSFNVALGNLDKTLNRVKKNIIDHIGLHFHRFLSSGKIKLFLSIVNLDDLDNSTPNMLIPPIDPMPKNSGSPNYPMDFKLDLDSNGTIPIKAYIWPKNSRDGEYKLNGANDSQGFYWYRNDRLIDFGGYKTGKENEPHGSLGRAAIELDPKFDDLFGLTVGKDEILPPQIFKNNVFKNSIAKDGTKLSEWIKKADEEYRKVTDKTKLISIIPKDGFGNKKQQEELLKIFHKDGTEKAFVTCVEIKFDNDNLFEIDVENLKLKVNFYRFKKMSPESSRLLKLSLFINLQPFFLKERLSAKQLEQMNNLQDTFKGLD